MTRPEVGGAGSWPTEHETYGDATHASWRDHAAADTGRRDAGRRDYDRPNTDWLTEGWDEVPRFNEHDRVVATTSVGGGLFKTVPAGTEGRVVATRSGLLTDYVTVEFANGYTEEVKTSHVSHVRTWF